jgi:hypothetical protein
MNKLIATLVAAAMLSATLSPAFASDRGKEVKPVANVTVKGHHDHRAKVAAGLAFGAVLIGAVIASRIEAENAESSCRTWRNSCRYGSERACYKYDTRC